MNTIERLLAIEEIKQLKARYFRLVDTKDWVGYRTVFADDVRFDVTEDIPESGIVIGADAATDIARRSLTGSVVSVHHGHCPEIEILSDTEARGIWAMEDVLRWNADSPYPGMTLHGMGHYHETYEKGPAGWRIKTLRLTRLRKDITRPT